MDENFSTILNTEKVRLAYVFDVLFDELGDQSHL